MADVDAAMGSNAIYRVSGRRLMFSSMAIDAVAGAFVVLLIMLAANSSMLTIYHPGMADGSDVTSPVWRLHAPMWFMIAMVPFLYMLVFYRRGIIAILYGIYAIFVIVVTAIYQIVLIVDWGECADKLWCACVDDYSVVGGMLTMDYCDPSDPGRASRHFVTHFWIQLILWLLCWVLAGLSVFVHIQYQYRNRAEEYNNANRPGDYMPVGEELGAGSTPPTSPEPNGAPVASGQSDKRGSTKPHLLAVKPETYQYDKRL